jgi:hypothetical protein
VPPFLKKKCKKGDNLLYAKGGWRDWPKSIEQDNILKWFNNLIKLFLGFIEEYRCYGTVTAPLYVT